MEHAVLDININNNGGSGSKKETQNSNRNAPLEHNEESTGRVFKRPRTRSQSNGMDILSHVKNKVGNDVYENRLEAIKKKYGTKATSDSKIGGMTAGQSKFAAIAGIATAAYAIKTVASTSIDIATINSSNQARKNAIDNMRSDLGRGLGTIGVVGAAAAAGGWVGAILAVIGLLIKTGADYAKLVAETNRRNEQAVAEANRKRNRLGYIETGYSR